jgi:ATP-dependent DNA ligase
MRSPPVIGCITRTVVGWSGRILVEPSVLIEIAFDIIQRSKLHASGYALRFPRIVRLRSDNGARAPTR